MRARVAELANEIGRDVAVDGVRTDEAKIVGRGSRRATQRDRGTSAQCPQFPRQRPVRDRVRPPHEATPHPREAVRPQRLPNPPLGCRTDHFGQLIARGREQKGPRVARDERTTSAGVVATAPRHARTMNSHTPPTFSAAS